MVKASFWPDFTAPSLRVSFVTIAKGDGADDLEAMNQTKHTTMTMIQRYGRHHNVRNTMRLAN